MSMISYDDALAIVLTHARQSATQKLPLLDALDKIAACDVQSLIQVPSFRNSAMDGFAVVSSQLDSASESNPITLEVTSAIAAGDDVATADAAKAVQIMTGAAVPEPYDAVIPVEMVAHVDSEVTFTKPPRQGDHIRHAGEDVALGQCILRKGERITPEIIMLLSAVGICEVEVMRLSRLHILSTGNEISDDYAVPLKGSQIYNSNAPYLLAAARQQSLEAQYEGIVRDEPALFEAKLTAITEPAIIISTGAVSKGVWDFIPDSLKKLGATIHFHRVNIRPGKPVLFATLPNGSYYFGLPGNPISAAIGFSFFVMPLVRALHCIAQPALLTAKLAGSFTKKGNFLQFLKAALAVDADGQLIADISEGQESFKISPMAANNAWVVLDGAKNQWSAGDTVVVIPYGEIIPNTRREAAVCQAA
ncbi:MAG: gephyrin-like molybdotransferase Glp [Pseudomonadota bacterium]